MNKQTNSNNIYTKNFIDHFTNPRNIGEINDADGYAKVGDPGCGDFIKVWLKIENDIIADYKYKVFGCGAAIATTSVASELAIGKSLKEAINLTDDDVIKTLGGIPYNKKHCSLLGINGLRAAIADYLVKNNHKKYIERIEKYRQAKYDIPKHRDEIVEFLEGKPRGLKILEIGTGKGELAIALARQGWTCLSTDNSNEKLYYARLNALYYKLDEKIEFMQQDARQLEFLKNSFDIVLSAVMLHHLPQIDPVLTEMYRVCRPDGLIIISDLNDKGKNIIQTLLQQEGKHHVDMGWKMDEIKKWFEMKNCQVKKNELECETVLIVKLIE